MRPVAIEPTQAAAWRPTLVWQKAWTTANGMAVAVAPAGSVSAAGQAPIPGSPANVDLVALKLAADGVSLAADGTLFVSGTVSTPSTSAFVVHLIATGKGTDANLGSSSGALTNAVSASPATGPSASPRPPPHPRTCSPPHQR